MIPQGSRRARARRLARPKRDGFGASREGVTGGKGLVDWEGRHVIEWLALISRTYTPVRPNRGAEKWQKKGSST